MPEEILETPQPTPPIEPVESRPTNWPKIILAAVLGFGLLAGSACAGYWYGTRETSKLKDQISNLQLKTQIPKTPTPEPTIPLITDPTADWKTYKSDKNGIEFKYPAGWHTRPHSGWTFQVFLENRPFEIVEGTSFMTSMVLHFNEFMNTTTGEKHYFEKTLNEGVARIRSLYGEDSVETDNLVIGGKKAVQVSGVVGPGMLEGRRFIHTLIQMDGHLLVVELTNGDFKDVYDQILSTFKFLD